MIASVPQLDNDLITQNCEKLLKLFEEAVHRNLADGILLSGGLDTSVIAAVVIRYTRPKAITVSLDNSPDAHILLGRTSS
jgi:asparagine synthetase B (glutamine-hydrolysing)